MSRSEDDSLQQRERAEESRSWGVSTAAMEPDRTCVWNNNNEKNEKRIRLTTIRIIYYLAARRDVAR